MTHSLANSDDDTVLKSLIDIAENLPKYLRPSIDEIFDLCLQAMQQTDDFEESRRHLALEVLITLSETSSAMVRKVAKKYLPRLSTKRDFNGSIERIKTCFRCFVLVPQLLEMMVDLDDDAEWSIKDTIEDEEDDRSVE